MAPFSILQIELYKADGQMDIFHMVAEEVVQYQDMAMSQIRSRATDMISPSVLKSITYDDDEGDACSLTTHTMPDALSFAAPIGDESVGVLRLQVQCLPSETASPAEEMKHAQSAETPVEESQNLVGEAADLYGMTLKDLKNKLREMDIGEDIIEAADDADDPKLKVIELILAKASPATHVEAEMPLGAERWQVLTNKGWQDYEAEMQVRLEQANKSSCETLSYFWGDMRFTIDLTKMTQSNLDTGRARPIRRTESTTDEASLADNVEAGAERWQVLTNKGWQDYEEDMQVKLELASKSSCKTLSYVWGDMQYTIDLIKNTQSNMETGRSRQIRRTSSSAEEAPCKKASLTVGELQDVEVHVGIICDGCNCSPIIGARFKSLERDDFDFCAKCFESIDCGQRGPDAWVQVKSDVRGDVIGSYYAPPVGNGEMTIHHGVMCDGCEANPILGRRFRACGEDFDLCSFCMESWKAGPQADSKTFEEITVISVNAAAAVATSHEKKEAEMEAGEVPPPEAFDFVASEAEPQDVSVKTTVKPKLAEAEFSPVSVCQGAIDILLQHPSEEIRSAVRDALLAAEHAENSKPLPFAPPPRAVQDVQPPFSVSDVDTESTESWNQAKEEDVQPPLSEASEADTESCIVVESDFKTPSGRVLNCAELMLGIEAIEDVGARGDVTAELAEVVQACGAKQAYRIGRIVLAGGNSTIKVPACARAVVMNDGEVPWPETAAVVIACGPDYGFPHMELGALNAGEAAEIVMDLSVPATIEGASRSVWVLVDTATGSLLGPTLCFEAIMQQ